MNRQKNTNNRIEKNYINDSPSSKYTPATAMKVSRFIEMYQAALYS